MVAGVESLATTEVAEVVSVASAVSALSEWCPDPSTDKNPSVRGISVRGVSNISGIPGEDGDTSVFDIDLDLSGEIGETM